MLLGRVKHDTCGDSWMSFAGMPKIKRSATVFSDEHRAIVVGLSLLHTVIFNDSRERNKLQAQELGQHVIPQVNSST